jgi:hypothetical protein
LGDCCLTTSAITPSNEVGTSNEAALGSSTCSSTFKTSEASSFPSPDSCISRAFRSAWLNPACACLWALASCHRRQRDRGAKPARDQKFKPLAVRQPSSFAVRCSTCVDHQMRTRWNGSSRAGSRFARANPKSLPPASPAEIPVGCVPDPESVGGIARCGCCTEPLKSPADDRRHPAWIVRESRLRNSPVCPRRWCLEPHTHRAVARRGTLPHQRLDVAEGTHRARSRVHRQPMKNATHEHVHLLQMPPQTPARFAMW